MNHIPCEYMTSSEPPQRGTENTKEIQQSPQRRKLEQTKRKYIEVRSADSLDSNREDEFDEGTI